MQRPGGSGTTLDMHAPEGPETDRWFGVFRSVEREPIGEVRYALAKRLRRNAIWEAVLGLCVVLAPLLLTALYWGNSSDGAFIAVGFAWLVGPVVGVVLLLSGTSRYRQLRGIGAGSEVEIFEGTANPAQQQDSVTARLLWMHIVEPGRRHRVVVHPETGLALEVDGALLQQLAGGDVSTTARLWTPAEPDASLLERPLAALEKRELELVARRVAQFTWGPALGAAGFLGVLVVVSSVDLNGNVTLGWEALFGSLVVLGSAAESWRKRRARRAMILRDAERGLQRVDNRWVLPESGVVWQEDTRPGALRLSHGGLGSEADGATRPMSF